MGVSMKNDPIKNPKKVPNLVFLHEKQEKKDGIEEFQTCFSMKERKCHRESVWQMQKYNCFYTPQGWIFMIGLNNSCLLFDFFNKKNIPLPSINEKGSLMHDQCACVITKDKGKYVVMFVDYTRQSIYFLDNVRSSKNKWIKHSYRDEEQEKQLCIVSTCNGQFFGASYINVLMIDYKPKPKITIMEALNIKTQLGSDCRETYMLEADEDLYCVCKHLSSPISRKVRAIVVWKRDSSLKAWNKVDNIGNQAFFLASSSTAAAWPATEIGNKGSLIYFVEKKDKMLYCYDMKAGTITVDVPCPRIRSQFCFARWVFPVL